MANQAVENVQQQEVTTQGSGNSHGSADENAAHAPSHPCHVEHGRSSSQRVVAGDDNERAPAGTLGLPHRRPPLAPTTLRTKDTTLVCDSQAWPGTSQLIRLGLN